MTFLLIFILLSFSLFLLWRLYFLRDPNRQIPKGEVIVSPADGTLLYIKRIKKGQVPIAIKEEKEIALLEINGMDREAPEDGCLLGIFMNPMSVHRNRIPIDGTLFLKNYVPSTSNLSMVKATTDILLKRVPLRDYEFYPVNERQTIGLNSKIGKVYVTQIADKWIKKIVCRVEIGDELKKGDQYGLIRFGSQCDLFLPDYEGLEIEVKIGEYLKAGSSIIAKY